MKKNLSYIQKNLKGMEEKANALLATSHKGACANGMTLIAIENNMDMICVAQRGREHHGETRQQLEPAPEAGKTNCLTTVSKDNLILQRPRGANKGGFHAHKSPTLSANSWEQNNLVAEMEANMKVGTYRTYKVDGGFRPMANNTKSPALAARARQDGSGQPCILMGGGGNNNANKKIDTERVC